MGLKNILFGKKKIISDKKIGDLKARIKNNNPSINYTWTSEFLLSGEENETVIMLEGNANGPYKNQLNAVYSIVDNLKKLREQILIDSKRLNLENLKYNSNRIKDFYFAAITPIDITENSFEVNLEPVSGDEDGYVLFKWKNNQVSDLEIK